MCRRLRTVMVRRRRMGEVRRLWRPVRDLRPGLGLAAQAGGVAGDDVTAPGAGRDGLDDQGRRSVPSGTRRLTGMSPATPPAPAMIAALYVERNGPYADLPGVQMWPECCDARRYPGPWPVVAHPPCARWGRYWSGGPSARVRRELGDDDGICESALAMVRKFGGVMEHPEASHAWERFGLRRPARGVGWTAADWYGGWTCCVEQGNYGHRARKLTWLYAVGCDVPSLEWGESAASIRMDDGYHSAEERRTCCEDGRLHSACRSVSGA